MAQPLVSICIPVHNGALMVRKALESCLTQSYENIEVIVVDNASTDATKKTVLEYQDKDERIRYFCNDADIGLFPNVFASFRYASGMYVQFLAHDDWLSRHYIEEGVKSFEAHPEAGAVFSGLLCLTTMNNVAFSFDRVVGLRNGRHSIDSVLRGMYRNSWSSLPMQAMVRKEDLRNIDEKLSVVYHGANYEDLRKEGLINDAVIISQILPKYSYVVFNGGLIYIKIDHSNNTGKWRDKNLNTDTVRAIIKSDYEHRKSFEFLYDGKLQRHLFGLRVFYGSTLITDLVFQIFKGGSIATIVPSVPDIRRFFNNYSFIEKFCVIFETPLILVGRALMYFCRSICKQGNSYSQEECFLDSQGHFVIET